MGTIDERTVGHADGNAVGSPPNRATSVVTSVSSKRASSSSSPKTTVNQATAAHTEFRDVYEGSDGYVNREELAEETEDNNYKEICRACVIRDIVEEGCNHCGIYHHVARLKLFKIQVARR